MISIGKTLALKSILNAGCTSAFSRTWRVKSGLDFETHSAVKTLRRSSKLRVVGYQGSRRWRGLRRGRLLGILVPPAPAASAAGKGARGWSTDRRGSRQSADRAPARGRAPPWCAPAPDRRRRIQVRSTEANSMREALRADHAARARRIDPGGGQHPLLRAHGEPVERQRRAADCGAPSAAASVRLRDAAPALRAGASARRTGARAPAPRPCRSKSSASTARSVALTWAARIASVEGNSPRNCASDTPAAPAMSARPICLERLFGKQRQQGRDDSSRARRSGRSGCWADGPLAGCGAADLRAGFAGGSAGHDRTPGRLRERVTTIRSRTDRM